MAFNAIELTCPWYVLGFALAILLTPVPEGQTPLFVAGAIGSVTLMNS